MPSAPEERDSREEVLYGAEGGQDEARSYRGGQEPYDEEGEEADEEDLLMGSDAEEEEDDEEYDDDGGSPHFVAHLAWSCHLRCGGGGRVFAALP